MTYDSLNWELEAKRVARAFGTNNEWCFNGQIAEGNRWLNVSLEGGAYNGSTFGAGALLIFSYSTYNRQFRLEQKVDGLLLGAKIELDWEGALEYSRVDWEVESIGYLTGSLARVLFYLDLLTPEIEAALHVSVSAHQKLEWTLEWTLEYEGQNEL